MGTATVPVPDAIPVAGQSKSYLYDNIGNRRLVGRDGSPQPSASEIYTANALNQYVARTVPSYIDVMGSATNISTVTVRDAAHIELPAPVIRQDDYFYKAYPVDNLSGFFSDDLEITAVINPAGTNDPDIVKAEVRSAFVPQTPEQFQYDDDGNLLSDGRFDYVWNGENRLITVSNQTALVASYAYDYLGRRISKTVGGETTTFLWNGNHIISEISNGPSQITNMFVWGQNDHLVSATLGGTNVFYCHDANKNITDLVDASGNGVAHYEFDPYGNINVKTGVLASTNPFKFSNKYYDPETGFVAYMFRYYEPPLGRWMNRDPIAEQGGLNLYGFVGNDPIGRTDKLGLSPNEKYDACDCFNFRIITRKVTGFLKYHTELISYSGEREKDGNSINVEQNKKIDSVEFEIILDENNTTPCCQEVHLMLAKVKANWTWKFGTDKGSVHDSWGASDTYVSGHHPGPGVVPKHPGYNQVWEHRALVSPVKNGDNATINWSVRVLKEVFDCGSSSLKYKKR